MGNIEFLRLCYNEYFLDEIEAQAIYKIHKLINFNKVLDKSSVRSIYYSYIEPYIDNEDMINNMFKHIDELYNKFYYIEPIQAKNIEKYVNISSCIEDALDDETIYEDNFVLDCNFDQILFDFEKVIEKKTVETIEELENIVENLTYIKYAILFNPTGKKVKTVDEFKKHLFKMLISGYSNITISLYEVSSTYSEYEQQTPERLHHISDRIISVLNNNGVILPSDKVKHHVLNLLKESVYTKENYEKLIECDITNIAKEYIKQCV